MSLHRRRIRVRCTPRVADLTSISPITTIQVVNLTGVGPTSHPVKVANPPFTASITTQLPELCWDDLLRDLKKGDVEQLCIVVRDLALYNHSEGMEPRSAREERFVTQSWEELAASNNPALALTHEFADVFPDKIPAVIPAGRGVRYEIDLVPGSKYCVTRQWPLPWYQVEVIDAFF